MMSGRGGGIVPGNFCSPYLKQSHFSVDSRPATGRVLLEKEPDAIALRLVLLFASGTTRLFLFVMRRTICLTVAVGQGEMSGTLYQPLQN